jgi:hypothetical protein
MPDTKFDIETLSAISGRLFDRADHINQVTLQELAADMRLAACACDKLAYIRFEIGEIAGKCPDPATARDLRAALDEVEN